MYIVVQSVSGKLSILATFNSREDCDKYYNTNVGYIRSSAIYLFEENTLKLVTKYDPFAVFGNSLESFCDIFNQLIQLLENDIKYRIGL